MEMEREDTEHKEAVKSCSVLCALCTLLENVRMIINNSGVAGIVSCVLLRGDIWRGNQS